MIKRITTPAGFLSMLFAALVLSLIDPPATLHVHAQGTNLEEMLFRQGETHWRKGNYEEAQTDFESVAKLNPRHPGVAFYRGLNLLRKGEVIKATAVLEAVKDHREYGPRARAQLADLKLKDRQEKSLAAINAYLEARAYTQAARECREALQTSPDNEELLFLTVFSATLAEDTRLANAALKRLEGVKGTTPDLKDLRLLLDAWASRNHAPDDALDRLLSISSERIRTAHVLETIKGLMISQSRFDNFEEFLLKEIARNPAGKDKIERELIRFYLDRGEFDKANDRIAVRPIESFEDNLLHVELIISTGEEKRGLEVINDLMVLSPDSMELREIWFEGFNKYRERTLTVPDWEMASGENVKDAAKRMALNLIRDPEASSNAKFKAFRVAASVSDEMEVERLLRSIIGLRVDERNLRQAITMAQDLSDMGFKSQSIRYLESILAQNPDSLDLQVSLAEHYHLENRSDLAVNLLAEAHANYPDNANVLVLYADCLAASGAPERARQILLRELDRKDLDSVVRRHYLTKLNQINFLIDPTLIEPESD